jgi:hypothetical protein
MFLVSIINWHNISLNEDIYTKKNYDLTKHYAKNFVCETVVGWLIYLMSFKMQPVKPRGSVILMSQTCVNIELQNYNSLVYLYRKKCKSYLLN